MRVTISCSGYQTKTNVVSSLLYVCSEHRPTLSQKQRCIDSDIIFVNLVLINVMLRRTPGTVFVATEVTELYVALFPPTYVSMK